MDPFKDDVRKGMSLFPDGPPKTPFMEELADRVQRLIMARTREERSGIASALIMSVRSSDDPVIASGGRTTEAGELLITEACSFVEERGEQVGSTLFGGAALRAALNTVQAVYASEFEEEEPSLQTAFL